MTGLLVLTGCGQRQAAPGGTDGRAPSSARERGREPAGEWVLEDQREWYAQNRDTPAGKLWASHEGPDWLPWVCENIADHKVAKGMTQQQVQLSLGKPEFVNQITAAYGPEWAYPKRQPPTFVYFAKGRVDRVDER